LLAQIPLGFRVPVVVLEVISKMKGRPLSLAAGGWGLSVILGIIVVGVFHLVPTVHAPMMVTLALCTTGLGTLMPIARNYQEKAYLLPGAVCLGEQQGHCDNGQSSTLATPRCTG